MNDDMRARARAHARLRLFARANVRAKQPHATPQFAQETKPTTYARARALGFKTVHRRLEKTKKTLYFERR